MKLSDINAVLKGTMIGPDCIVNNINTDTRTLKGGDLFVALRGDKLDGHQFILNAQKQGAIAVVVDTPIAECKLGQLVVSDTTQALGLISRFIRSQFKGPLVAITGSCGKTSVKGFLRSIFEQMGSVVATQGNFNNHIGVPLTLNNLRSEHDFAVIEMGASGLGEISYLAQLAQPTVAVVNNVRPAHVQGFGGIDAIAYEKGQIYAALNDQGIAVINCDDAYCLEYLAQTTALKRIAFGRLKNVALTGLPFVTATNIGSASGGCFNFTLHYLDQSANVQLQVLGEHFIDNALAAAACAFACGASIKNVIVGLEKYTGEKGRMQLVPNVIDGQKALFINDAYNANPGSARAAIDYLSQQPQKYKVLVLGDMGELGKGEIAEHSSIGIYAAEKGINIFIAVGALSKLAAEAFTVQSEIPSLIFSSLDDVEPVIRQWLKEPAVILIKGSRSSGVDRLISIISDNNKRLSLC